MPSEWAELFKISLQFCFVHGYYGILPYVKCCVPKWIFFFRSLAGAASTQLLLFFSPFIRVFTAYNYQQCTDIWKRFFSSCFSSCLFFTCIIVNLLNCLCVNVCMGHKRCLWLCRLFSVCVCVNEKVMRW